MAAELVGEAFDDPGHRQPAGVGGDDRARLANGFDAAQQAALDLEVFHHGLDDPVHVSQLLQIVFEVADGDQPGQRRLEKRGRPGLDRSFQSGGGETVAHRTVRIGRDDVQKVGGNTGIGQVRGDAGAHGARAQNGDFLNSFLHEMFPALQLQTSTRAT